MVAVDVPEGDNMLTFLFYAVVGFLAGIGTGALICKFKCNKTKTCDPLIDVDDFWDPAAGCSTPTPKKRKSKGKRKGK